MKNLSLVCAMLFCTALVQAQVGIGTTSPDPNSILDIQSNDKGLLIPRIFISDVNNYAPLSGMLRNGFMELTAGYHTINVYVFGAGGGNTGFDLTYFNGNDARFQIIHHN